MQVVFEGQGKEKERKSIYIAPFRTNVHTKRSGMDHTVLPANNTMPAFQGQGHIGQSSRSQDEKYFFFGYGCS